jgi:hypothetical protein
MGCGIQTAHSQSDKLYAGRNGMDLKNRPRMQMVLEAHFK